MVLDEVMRKQTYGTLVGEKDVYNILKGGKRHGKKTTLRRHMLLKWKDISNTWNVIYMSVQSSRIS